MGGAGGQSNNRIPKSTGNLYNHVYPRIILQKVPIKLVGVTRGLSRCHSRRLFLVSFYHLTPSLSLLSWLSSTLTSMVVSLLSFFFLCIAD